MSNQVKNAIDMGLHGLSVTERDVSVILRRARTEKKPVRKPASNWGFAAAIAAVLVMLVLGAGVKLLGGTQDVTPLDQPESEVTYVPGENGEFLPVGKETAPQILISSNEAIAIAEAYVQANEEPADLRDGRVYQIGCEWKEQVRENNAFFTNFYEVSFRTSDAYATAYTVRVKADDGHVICCQRQRGAGEGHTAQEIYIGLSRVYGEDRRTWPQSALTEYVRWLNNAQKGSLRWMDFLYRQTVYPDTADAVLDREDATATVLASLLGSAALEEPTLPCLVKGSTWEVSGSPRARYISDWPTPIWKVAVDLNVTSPDGYTSLQTLLVEVDSVTGDVQHMEVVDVLYAEARESFLHATIETLEKTPTTGCDPVLTMEEYEAIAANYVRETWGETRDIRDDALFALTVEDGLSPLTQCEYRLIYCSNGIGDKTEYDLLIDWYGQVVEANRGVSSASGEPFTPTAIQMHWEYEKLLAWQEKARAAGLTNDPAVSAFINTTYVDDKNSGYEDRVRRELAQQLGIRSTGKYYCILIDSQPHDVYKMAIETDHGNYLVEMDCETAKIISVMRVGSIYDSWYLPYVLTADLQAAGVPLTWEAGQQPHLNAATADHGATGGMRIDHLYERFRHLYGADMADWTQEQLRSFQQMAIVSSDYDNDLAIPCLRNTVYPDIPANAISRDAAMAAAAKAIGLKDGWTYCGGVLIGTDADSDAAGTPVWKVCVYGERDAYFETGEGFWYVEVNCMTGQVYRTHGDDPDWANPGAFYDDGTPHNLWFREIVLEDTIDECETFWDCKSHG